LHQYFKKRLPEKLFSHSLFLSRPFEAIEEVISRIEFDLQCNKEIDTRFSGTTLCMIVVRDQSILVANVGDSRVCLGRMKALPSDSDTSDIVSSNESTEDDPGCTAYALSQDHKPDVSEEFLRITSRGGRIFCLGSAGGEWGPVRVWLPTINAPGLAMTRSLCDDVIHTVGVTSTVEFGEHHFHKTRDAVLVVGTDGLWDEMTNQEVIDMCLTCTEPDDAAARYDYNRYVTFLLIRGGVYRITREARKRQLVRSPAADDVSACVAFLSGHPAEYARQHINSA
jgi:serine/threonine protein phosphatase PrpC